MGIVGKGIDLGETRDPFSRLLRRRVYVSKFPFEGIVSRGGSAIRGNSRVSRGRKKRVQ